MITAATWFCLGCCFLCLVCLLYSTHVTRTHYKTAIDEVQHHFETREEIWAEHVNNMRERCSSCKDKSHSVVG